MILQRSKRWSCVSRSTCVASVLLFVPCEECSLDCTTAPPVCVDPTTDSEGPAESTDETYDPGVSTTGAPGSTGTTVATTDATSTTYPETDTGDDYDLPCEPEPIEIECCDTEEAVPGCDVMITCTGAASEPWPKRFGDRREQYAFSVALDPDDAIVIAGRARGRLIAPTPEIKDAQRQYVARIDREEGCGETWVHAFESIEELTADPNYTVRATVADDGMIYAALAIAGGEIKEGAGELDAGLLVVKLDPEGTLQEQHRLFETEGDRLEITAIGSDGAGVFIAGSHWGTLHYDEANVSVAPGEDQQAFLVRVNADSLAYEASMGVVSGETSSRVRALHVESGVVVAAGSFEREGELASQLDIGCALALGGDGQEGFVARFETVEQGLLCQNWELLNVDLGEVEANAITRDHDSGEITVVGSFHGALDYQQEIQSMSMEKDDCFVLTTHDDLSLVSLGALNSQEDVKCYGAAYDKSGNLLIGGRGDGSIVSPHEITLTSDDSFIVKWDAGGEPLWDSVLESVGPDTETDSVSLWGLAVDSSNHTVAVGSVYGEVSMYGVSLAPSPDEPRPPEDFDDNEDVFVVVADP